jgi:hypothetical protein
VVLFSISITDWNNTQYINYLHIIGIETGIEDQSSP